MNEIIKQFRQSLKSKDTEEWLDVYFTRPIGFAFALLWNRLGVHPNVITILSIVLGVAAGVIFYYTDFAHNLLGMFLLMLANFCDSTDGQMARLSGKTSVMGRILDGLSGDLWFASVYIAIAFRLMPQHIPFTQTAWSAWAWVLVCVAGLLCHSPQASLADYYRQIHLYFLKGEAGSELTNSQQQTLFWQSIPPEKWFQRLFFRNYASYCRSQEKRTPCFQLFFRKCTLTFGNATLLPENLRQQFLNGSKPLMPCTNILSFNTRAIVLYASCLADMPWIYPLFEMSALTLLYIYMRARHESMCRRLTSQLS